MEGAFMNDETTTVVELRELLAKFVQDRAWGKYHRPKELAIALLTEAAELMENFLWHDDAEVEELIGDKLFRERICDEMSDILAFLIAFANRVGVDISSSLEAKIKKNESKYPVEESYGKYRRPS